MNRLSPAARSPASFSTPSTTGMYRTTSNLAAPFVPSSPYLSETRLSGATSLAAPVVSKPTFLSGAATLSAPTIPSMTRSPAASVSAPQLLPSLPMQAQTIPSTARAPAAVVSAPQLLSSLPMQAQTIQSTARAPAAVVSAPPVQAQTIQSMTRAPAAVMPQVLSSLPAQTTRSAKVISTLPTQGVNIDTPIRVGNVVAANPVGLSATTAKVISSPIQAANAIGATVLETTAIKEVSVVAATKKITREEMIAKGILIQAAPMAGEIPVIAQEMPAMTQEMPAMTQEMPDFLAVFQGLKEPPVYESHHFNSLKWNSVQPRADDIIIATAYKAGTTWMQQIVSEILFQGQEKPASVGDMSPWVDLRVPPVEVLEPMVEGQTWRRFLKTHMPADAFLPYFQRENKYIYVARDGRDAFMSLMNHYEKGNDAWYGALNGPGLVGDPFPDWAEVGGDVASLFDAWLSRGWHTHPDETDGWPFWSYFKNVKTWWNLAFGDFGLDNIYFVHFNNMKKDLDGEMRKIAEFLEVPVNEEVWAECVWACTFDEMHKNADVVAPLNGVLWEGGGKSFIFKGTNERWRGVLSEAQVAAYEAKAVQELGEDCARFMATGAF